ncbi:MAG TPA: hypothetical protein VHL99_02410, partial [Candidatus Binatia bacterium]|nr:hypothetical protein [Candidatus Binatia bacterium]
MRWVATALSLALYAGNAAASEPADAPRIAMSADRLASLQAIVRTGGAAARPFDSVKRTADRALAERPQPVKRIVSEGTLYSNPEKKRSLAARRDLFNIEALGYAYAVTGNWEYGGKAREFILA